MTVHLVETPFTAAELWRGVVLSVKVDAQLQQSRDMSFFAVRRTSTIRRRCKPLKGVELECMHSFPTSVA